MKLKPKKPVPKQEINKVAPVLIERPPAPPVVLNFPPPDALLAEAEMEPDQAVLSEYSEVIDTLRAKGFSYREIASWLSQRGVQADHNAVYRVYTKGMHPVEQMGAEAEKQEEDMQES